MEGAMGNIRVDCEVTVLDGNPQAIKEWRSFCHRAKLTPRLYRSSPPASRSQLVGIMTRAESLPGRMVAQCDRLVQQINRAGFPVVRRRIIIPERSVSYLELPEPKYFIAAVHVIGSIAEMEEHELIHLCRTTRTILKYEAGFGKTWYLEHRLPRDHFKAQAEFVLFSTQLAETRGLAEYNPAFLCVFHDSAEEYLDAWIPGVEAERVG